MRQVVIDRRTFLKAAGASAAAVLVAPTALAQAPTPASAVASLDPILAQAMTLGFDRDRILRFVADEVAYEPYAGVLRGATTTLLGHAGNAADKAVLLAALLKASMIESRFVTGTLDDAAAATLAGTTLDRDAVRARAEVALHGDPAVTLPSVPEPDAATLAILDRLPEIDASVTAWASSAIDTSVRQITEALAGAGIGLPTGPAPLPDTELQRHLWVQARSGTEWVDLDPTLAGTQPGVAIASAVGEPLATIPDDLRHRLDIDLVLEKVAGGGVTQEAIIEHSAFADELTDVPIAIGHAKPGALKQLGAGIESVLLGGTRYLAILQIGPTAYVGLSPLILAGGDPADPSAPADPFGGIAGPREGEAIAEWLELRITAPDGTMSTARRTLFDRIGEAARVAGSVDPTTIPPAQLLDLGPDHSDEFLPLTTARFLSVATGAKAWPTPDIPEGQEALALGIPVQMYHVARDITNAILSLDRGVAVHLAAPNVTMHSYELAAGPDGTVSITESLDLLHRSFGVLPVGGAAAGVPAGVLAGATSHVAERLRGGAGLPADLASGMPGLSVGALFERADADDIGLRVLRGSVPADLGYPPEATRRLADALADGWVAIAPERPVTMGDEERLGWWLVDPATGATVDMLDDGRGVEMAEYGLLIITGMILTVAAFMAFRCVAATYRNVTGLLRARRSLDMPAGVGDIPLNSVRC
jgi:Transglutaminase-like superfamily